MAKITIEIEDSDLRKICSALHSHVAELECGEGYADNGAARLGLEEAKKIRAILKRLENNKDM